MCYIKKLIDSFLEHFWFTEKLYGKYRDFQYTPWPSTHSQPPLLSTFPTRGAYLLQLVHPH